MHALQSLTVVAAALFRVSWSPTVSGRALGRPIVVHGRAIPPVGRPLPAALLTGRAQPRII
jgi:hypothetical protein